MVKNKNLLIITSGIMALSITGWWTSISLTEKKASPEESYAPDGIPMTAERQRVVEELTESYVIPTPEERARIRAELGL